MTTQEMAALDRELKAIGDLPELYACLRLDSRKRDEHTPHVIKRQYLLLSREYHPDKVKSVSASTAVQGVTTATAEAPHAAGDDVYTFEEDGKTGAAPPSVEELKKEFYVIDTAYKILIVPEKKRLYDILVTNVEKSKQIDMSGLVALGEQKSAEQETKEREIDERRKEIIASFANKYRASPTKEEEREAPTLDVPVSLDHVETGGTAGPLQISRKALCKDCVDKDCTRKCTDCNETGLLMQYRRIGTADHQIQKAARTDVHCKTCSGYIHLTDCKTCGGTQEVQETHELTVQIPRGVVFGDAGVTNLMGQGHYRRESWRREHVRVRFIDADHNKYYADLAQSLLQELGAADDEQETKGDAKVPGAPVVRISRSTSDGPIYYGRVTCVHKPDPEDLTVHMTVSWTTLIGMQTEQMAIKLPGKRQVVVAVKDLLPVLTKGEWYLSLPQQGLPTLSDPAIRGTLHIRVALQDLDDTDYIAIMAAGRAMSDTSMSKHFHLEQLSKLPVDSAVTFVTCKTAVADAAETAAAAADTTSSKAPGAFLQNSVLSHLP